MTKNNCGQAVLDYICSELNIECYKPEKYMIQMYIPEEVHDLLARRYNDDIPIESRIEEFDHTSENIRDYLWNNKDKILNRISELGLPKEDLLIKDIEVGADDMEINISVDAIEYDDETGEKIYDNVKSTREEYDQVYVDIHLDDVHSQW